MLREAILVPLKTPVLVYYFSYFFLIYINDYINLFFIGFLISSCILMITFHVYGVLASAKNRSK